MGSRDESARRWVSGGELGMQDGQADPGALKRAICNILLEEETVTRALKRLRPKPVKAGSKRKAAGRSISRHDSARRDADSFLSQLDEGAVHDEAEAKASFERLTDAASELMDMGFEDIYVETKEQILGSIEDGLSSLRGTSKFVWHDDGESAPGEHRGSEHKRHYQGDSWQFSNGSEHNVAADKEKRCGGGIAAKAEFDLLRPRPNAAAETPSEGKQHGDGPQKPAAADECSARGRDGQQTAGASPSGTTARQHASGEATAAPLAAAVAGGPEAAPASGHLPGGQPGGNASPAASSQPQQQPLHPQPHAPPHHPPPSASHPHGYSGWDGYYGSQQHYNDYYASYSGWQPPQQPYPLQHAPYAPHPAAHSYPHHSPHPPAPYHHQYPGYHHPPLQAAAPEPQQTHQQPYQQQQPYYSPQYPAQQYPAGPPPAGSYGRMPPFQQQQQQQQQAFHG